MEKMTYIALGVLISFMCLGLTGYAKDMDALEAAPGDYIVLLENEHVRVLEVKIQPGGKEIMHTHPATVHIPLAPANVKITYPDGKSIIRTGEPGGAIWVGPEKHALENMGDNVIHAYIVELKDIPYVEPTDNTK